jgi:hypothetical protein
MDDMTIFNPTTGKDRYRINQDLQVEDLSGPCPHLVMDPQRYVCTQCGMTRKEIIDER